MQLAGSMNRHTGEFDQEGQVAAGDLAAFGTEDCDLHWGVVTKCGRNPETGRPEMDIIPILQEMHDDLMFNAN